MISGLMQAFLAVWGSFLFVHIISFPTLCKSYFKSLYNLEMSILPPLRLQKTDLLFSSESRG